MATKRSRRRSSGADGDQAEQMATKRSRPATPAECSCLKDALVLIEKQNTIRTLAAAKDLLRRVDAFRVAKVLLASKVSAKFFVEDQTAEMTRKIETENMAEVLEEIRELREFPCCRGHRKHLTSSQIVSVIAPLMRGRRLAKKMSAYTPMIEIMLQFTEVVVEKDDSEWEEVCDWMNDKVAGFPLLAKILG